MEIKFSIRGVKEVQAFLKTVPRGTMKAALEAMAKYFVGDSRHGLKHNEPYKYVSRKAAGYKTSAAQMRYFFAVGILERTADGGIILNKYKRTNATSDAWTYKEASPYEWKLVNPTIGAWYTRSDSGQARQPAKVGWRKVSAVVAANMKGALQRAQQAVDAWIKSKK